MCIRDSPNTFLRSGLCETRLIGALTRHMKFDGFLRWNYTVWPDDPRRDIRYGAFAAGDTNFVYPARNGYPLLSLRYMALRRAIEDFELLRCLDEAGRAQEADELAGSVLREKDVRKYFFPAKEEGAPSDSLPLGKMCSVDYRDYEKMRRRALELLSERYEPETPRPPPAANNFCARGRSLRAGGRTGPPRPPASLRGGD